jgi:hypothetical protein
MRREIFGSSDRASRGLQGSGEASALALGCPPALLALVEKRNQERALQTEEPTVGDGNDTDTELTECQCDHCSEDGTAEECSTNNCADCRANMAARMAKFKY